MSLRIAVALSALVALATYGTRPTWATLLVAPSTIERGTRADVVVVGRVEGSRAGWEGRRVVTRAWVVREQMIKGSVPTRVDVLVPGGTIDGIGMRVLGAAELRDGDRAMFFLAGPRALDGGRAVLDLGAGALPIERGPDGVDRVRDETGAMHSLTELAAGLQP